MLWVNLIMDSLGSLSLATEPPYYELLNRKPTRKNESIINGRMWKHIILQSMFQLLLLLALYLWAPLFITESNLSRLAENKIINECYGVLPGEAKNINNIIFGTESSWSSDIRILNNANEMKCGSYNDRQNLGMAFKEYMSRNGSTVHMTLIFNVFVFYTLFNQVNCRVINDGFNIFVRINKCILFILITSCEMGLQALLVEFGSYAFHVTKNGLTIRQWLITFGFAATTFVLSFIIKLIPLEKAIQPYLDVEEDHSYHEENEEKDNIIKNDIDDEKKGLLEEEEI
jgi:Ca2+ transporting ATPase